jgi:peptide/nickel transport system substrate-binding protein
MNTTNVFFKVLFLTGFFFLLRGDIFAQSKNEVTIHILSDPESLIPYNSNFAEEINIENQIFDPLLRMNPVTCEPDIPWLAESLPIESKDHKQFDFTLRKGIKFADGVELTGEDVIFSLKVAKNFLQIKNPSLQKYLQSIKSAELIDGDPYRIRFILTKPDWQIRQSVFADILRIIPKHIFNDRDILGDYSWDDLIKRRSEKKYDQLENFTEWFGSPDLQRDPKYIFGTGPYQLKNWIPNDKVVLEKNPNYTNKFNSEYGNAYPDEIIYKQISDWSAAITAIKSKDLDLIGYVQSAQWNNLDTAKLLYLSKTAFPQSTYTYIGWNLERPFFKDKKVRLALAHLIDRKTMIDKVLYGLAEQTQTPVSPLRPEHKSDIPLITFDTVIAKKLLKEAGWVDHDGDGIIDKKIGDKYVPFKFQFMINSGNETRKKILLVYAEGLRKMGIHADILALEWSVYLDRLRDHTLDAWCGAWQNDDGENDFFQLYHSSQAKNKGSNYGGWKNKSADHILEAIRKEVNQNKRKKLENEFQKIFYEEQPIALLWNPHTSVIWNNRFDNVKWYPLRPGYNPAWWIPRK